MSAEHRESPSNTLRRLSAIVLLGWISTLGFDFFLHAGLLSSLYIQPSPFLLPPLKAFMLIPVGYLSFLIMDVLLLWLIVRLEIKEWIEGLVFGLKVGGLIWGSLVLGLLSLSTASVSLLVGWFFGQTIELGIAGAVMGGGLAGRSLKQLSAIVLVFVLIMVTVTIALQSLGLAPSTKI